MTAGAVAPPLAPSVAAKIRPSPPTATPEGRKVPATPGIDPLVNVAIAVSFEVAPGPTPRWP